MKVYDSYTNTFYDNSERQQTVASDRTESIPTMVYPQVDGITPTVVKAEQEPCDDYEAWKQAKQEEYEKAYDYVAEQARNAGISI